MDPSTVDKIANSETGKILVSRLWPSMLFVVVMVLIGSGMLAAFTVTATTSREIGFWLLFSTFVITTIIGWYLLILDAKILTSSERVASSAARAETNANNTL